ncbi:DUF4190 domain-containing protein [Streptomyces sp. NPDC002133]|uniref:DUF4190 domain-containing protein n=1 Tax=Streptomyces sp. NPDC002133 TaxID=3154409 RepID=UPI003323DA23
MPTRMPMAYAPYGIPPRPSTNGFAIGSLVTGIVCCLPPLGLVLGVIALVQIRKKGQDGRGLAISGTVLSVISTMLMTVAFATGGAGAAWDGFRGAANESASSRSTLDLRTGQCFDIPGEVLEEDEVASVEIVPCTVPHDAEVSGTHTLDMDDWPGEPSIDDLAATTCEDIDNAYALDWWAIPENAETYYYIPSKGSWWLGDRTITCTFGAMDGKLHASVRNDSTTLGPAQLAYLESEEAAGEQMFHEPQEAFGDRPAANRQWARQVSRGLAAQAHVLHGVAWPGTARKAAESRAKEFEAASGHWARAAGAEDENAFWEHRFRAEESLRLTTETAVRDALGLTIVPPVWLSEEDAGDPDDPESEEL